MATATKRMPIVTDVHDPEIPGKLHVLDEYRRKSATPGVSRGWTNVEEFLDQYCRPATLEEWGEWLAKHQTRHERVEYVSEPFADGRMFVLVSQVDSIPKFYGSQAIRLLVPDGIVVEIPTGHMAIGHNEVYLANGRMAGIPKSPPMFRGF